MNTIKFFFEYKGVLMQLPVNPEEIMIVSDGANERREIVKLGEIVILRDKRLKSIEIKSFLPVSPSAPYVLTRNAFLSPQTYIEAFELLRDSKQPCRLVISGINISMLVAFENFEYGMRAGDPDYHFRMQLCEYRSYGVKTFKEQKTNTPAVTIPAAPAVIGSIVTRPKTGFAVGDKVTANGKYWYTSYGESPFGTFKNFAGKISKIVADKNRKYRYHITTLDGGWRGWVAENQISHAQ